MLNLFHFFQKLNNRKLLKQIASKYWFMCFLFHISAANNSGVNKRQITDLVDQSIQINAHCFVVTADNRYILICGFWDKSFRVYSTETGKPHAKCLNYYAHVKYYPGSVINGYFKM